MLFCVRTANHAHQTGNASLLISDSLSNEMGSFVLIVANRFSVSS